MAITNPWTIAPVNQTYRLAYLKNITINAGSTTGSATPIAGHYLHELSLSISANATLSGGGIVTVQVLLNNKLIREELVYVSNNASNRGRILDTGSVNFFDINYPVVAGDLTITLSPALTVGTTHVNAYFSP